MASKRARSKRVSSVPHPAKRPRCQEDLDQTWTTPCRLWDQPGEALLPVLSDHVLPDLACMILDYALPCVLRARLHKDFQSTREEWIRKCLDVSCHGILFNHEEPEMEMTFVGKQLHCFHVGHWLTLDQTTFPLIPITVEEDYIQGYRHSIPSLRIRKPYHLCNAWSYFHADKHRMWVWDMAEDEKQPELAAHRLCAGIEFIESGMQCILNVDLRSGDRVRVQRIQCMERDSTMDYFILIITDEQIWILQTTVVENKIQSTNIWLHLVLPSYLILLQALFTNTTKPLYLVLENVQNPAHGFRELMQVTF